MKQKIRNLILQAAKEAFQKGDLPASQFPCVEIEESKIALHGDFSTNISMVMAATQKMSPRKIAELILKHMHDPDGLLSKIEIAGPGFINFFIKPSFWYPFLREIHETNLAYGATDIGQGEKVLIEFVSANPTGPLHVGHGRGAAVGDSVANILSFCGYDVKREYYINDSGRQINTLGRSVFLRYKELFGQNIEFPQDCYQGDYIVDLAVKIREDLNGDLLSRCEDDAIAYCARFAAENILNGIQADLESFGVHFDQWYCEQSLYDSGKVDQVIENFSKKNIIYKKDGAIWFKTTEYGDEKDRVVVRTNGQTTYFASDIAYHQDKFERGFNRVIDVWGADHHGYIPRMAASIAAAGYHVNQFHVILVQLVNLLRGGEPVAMSTRAGEFVTLENVISEVGSDAARFLFLTRHYDSPLDFDLELAKKKTNDNPVFYVQYVHARIASIAAKGLEKGIQDVSCWNEAAVAMLKEPEEIQLIKNMARYPEIIRQSAEFMEPHRITFYLMNLAASFHAYYNKHRVLTDEYLLTHARLYLVSAVKKVIRNGLTLLGVSAPERM
ncbi:MAG: arginine--tRNA ligase [Desulfobacterales bacterium]|nr:arginine--tRNA ligase [Desulfobacterales bacterium]